MKINILKAKSLWVIASLLIVVLSGCESGFDPPSIIERLRILGVKVQTPEVNPLIVQDATNTKIKIALLAANENGIVADGTYSDEGYIKKGYDIKWALCSYSFKGMAVEDPDCTKIKDRLLPDKTPVFEMTLFDLLNRLSAMYESDDSGSAWTVGQETTDEKEVEFPQEFAVSISAGDEKEWAIKSLVISNRPTEELNQNPPLNKVLIEGKELKQSFEPSFELQSGYAYKITFDYDIDHWQEYYVEQPDKTRELKEELYFINVQTTAGSFNQDESVSLWMKNKDMNELFWRAPLEVPDEGLEVTLIFTMFDFRGGVDWKWGTVKVVRSDAMVPR